MIDLTNITKAQYVFCCELIWGGVPVDPKDKDGKIVKWVGTQSPLFKDLAPKILEKYPKLDQSFFDQKN